jgi:hypothetical protein
VLLDFASAANLVSKFLTTWDIILLSVLRPGSLSIATCDSQGYCGGYLTHLHKGYIPTVLLHNNNKEIRGSAEAIVQQDFYCLYIRRSEPLPSDEKKDTVYRPFS